MNTPALSSEACAIERIGHIQKKICVLWGSPELDAYINKLLMDSRDGQRQGFPVQVTQELLFLAEFNKFIQAIDLARKLKISLRDALQKLDQVDIDPDNPLAGGGGRTDRGTAQVDKAGICCARKKRKRKCSKLVRSDDFHATDKQGRDLSNLPGDHIQTSFALPLQDAGLSIFLSGAATYHRKSIQAALQRAVEERDFSLRLESDKFWQICVCRQ